MEKKKFIWRSLVVLLAISPVLDAGANAFEEFEKWGVRALDSWRVNNNPQTLSVSYYPTERTAPLVSPVRSKVQKKKKKVNTWPFTSIIRQTAERLMNYSVDQEQKGLSRKKKRKLGFDWRQYREELEKFCNRISRKKEKCYEGNIFSRLNRMLWDFNEEFRHNNGNVGRIRSKVKREVMIILATIKDTYEYTKVKYWIKWGYEGSTGLDKYFYLFWKLVNTRWVPRQWKWLIDNSSRPDVKLELSRWCKYLTCDSKWKGDWLAKARIDVLVSYFNWHTNEKDFNEWVVNSRKKGPWATRFLINGRGRDSYASNLSIDDMKKLIRLLFVNLKWAPWMRTMGEVAWTYYYLKRKLHDTRFLRWNDSSSFFKGSKYRSWPKPKAIDTYWIGRVEGLTNSQLIKVVDALCFEEARCNYQLVNRLWYLWAFQKGAEKLLELKLIKESRRAIVERFSRNKSKGHKDKRDNYSSVHKRFLQNSYNWTNWLSLEAYLKDPNLQNRKVVESFNNTIRYLWPRYLSKIWQWVQWVKITLPWLLFWAHLAWNQWMKNFLDGKKIKPDANWTTIQDFIRAWNSVLDS